MNSPYCYEHEGLLQSLGEEAEEFLELPASRKRAFRRQARKMASLLVEILAEGGVKY